MLQREKGRFLQAAVERGIFKLCVCLNLVYNRRNEIGEKEKTYGYNKTEKPGVF